MSAKAKANAYANGMFTNKSFHHENGDNINPIEVKIPPFTFF
jgi:hypothetical protein